jgi:AP-2 complex subunit mu-1
MYICQAKLESSDGPRVLLYVGDSPNFHHARQLGNIAKACTMLSGILIFNQKGENLIFRAFRSDCRPRLADIFRIQVISNPQLRSPTLTLGSTTFSHVKHENIYLVAITKSNANAALVFEFLYRLIALGKGYFGKFDEEAVKNNFVLVYELLDGELWRLCVPASC